MNRILKKLLPLFFAGGALLSSGAHAVTCETFAAGDTDYVAKLNLLVAGCSPTSNLVSSLPRAAAGGTVDAITATFSPAITLADQTIVAVVAAGANATTTPTFAPNGLTAHTITARGGGALVAGDIAGAGFVALLEYNLANTRWELLNPSASSASGTVTHTGGDLAADAIVLGAGGADTKTVSGFVTDGTSELTLGEAGVSAGSIVFKNATSGRIILQPTTGALGTRTITMPATTGTMALTSDIVAPTLTATYVGYGSGSNLMTGTSDLTYATATGSLALTKPVAGIVSAMVHNTNGSASSQAVLYLRNDGGTYTAFGKTGTAYTPAGLFAADQMYLYNPAGSTLIANAGSTDFIWSRGGTAATNEVMRMGAGALSLGVAGTTTGAVTVHGTTSTDSFTISGRNNIGTQPVPYLTPTTNNTAIALDIFPKGTATDAFAGAAAIGVAWQDICSSDIVADGTNYECLRSGKMAAGYAHIGTAAGGTGTVRPLVLQYNGGNIAVGTTVAPTARLHLPAGTTAASSAPLKLTSGSLLTTAEAGGVEFLTDKAYFTITTGAARKELTLNDAALTSGRVPYTTTNGRITDESGFTFNTTTGVLGVNKSVTGQAAINITNANSGNGASACFNSTNDNSETFSIGCKVSSTYTTSGLLTASQGYFYNPTGTTVMYNAAAADFIWARSGIAATNQVMRLGAGTLTLGVAGTTVGSLALTNATSGTITLSPVTGALGTIAISVPALAGRMLVNSAVNVVSPTSPNRTLTVQGSDGTTYYIAAKTSND